MLPASRWLRCGPARIDSAQAPRLLPVGVSALTGLGPLQTSGLSSGGARVDSTLIYAFDGRTEYAISGQHTPKRAAQVTRAGDHILPPPVARNYTITKPQRALSRRSGRMRQLCLADKSRMIIRRREAYEHPVMPLLAWVPPGEPVDERGRDHLAARQAPTRRRLRAHYHLGHDRG